MHGTNLMLSIQLGKDRPTPASEYRNKILVNMTDGGAPKGEKKSRFWTVAGVHVPTEDLGLQPKA